MGILLAIGEPAVAAPTVWTFAQKGDADGTIVENSSTSLTINASSSDDEANIDYAYQSVSSGDIQLICTLPSSYSGTLEDFSGFGIGLTEGTADGDYFVQNWWPNIGTARAKFGTPPSFSTQTGIASQSLPYYLAITYDDTANEIRAWESADNIDWFQIGATISKTLTYDVLAYVFGTSHDTPSTSTATITGCTLTGTITISEAVDPGNRTGIIQEITVLDTTFGPQGDVVDGIVVQTWDTSNSYHANDGGTWDSNWNTTRVDILTEEGVSGPETDDALRNRIEYDIPYTDEQNAPRDKIFWSPGGFSEGLNSEAEYWLGAGIFLPSDYDSDGEFGRETLLQLHNDSTAAGEIAIVIDQGKFRVLERLSLTTQGGTTRTHLSQDVSTDLGEWIYLVINWKFNPASTSTLIDASHGAKAQIGETMPANGGKLRVWKSLAPGASCTSLDLGTVTNSGGSRADFLINDLDGAPVGRVWDWMSGISPRGSILPEWGMYKSAWFDGEPFATRPAIPHASSDKPGPIVWYLASARLGDSSSNYASVHPLQSVEPT